mgnify:CR=1 FL=1
MRICYIQKKRRKKYVRSNSYEAQDENLTGKE